MVTFGFFIGLAVLTFVILVIIAIATIIGALALNKSQYFNTNIKVKNAHAYLTAAAVISTIIAFIMLILLGWIIFKNPFSDIQISEAFLANTTPTAKDLSLAVLTGKKLQDGETGRLIILIVLFLLSLTVIILAILCVLAAYEMSQVLTRDQKAVDGANAAFIASFAALFEVGFIIIVSILSYQLKSEASTDITKLDTVLEKNAEKKSTEKKVSGISCATDPNNPSCTPV